MSGWQFTYPLTFSFKISYTQYKLMLSITLDAFD